MSALDKLLKKTQEQKEKEKTVSRIAVKTQHDVKANQKKKAAPSGGSILKEGSGTGSGKVSKKVSISTPDGVATPEPLTRSESLSPAPSLGTTRSMSTSPIPSGPKKLPWVRSVGILPEFNRKDFEDVFNAIIELLLGRKRIGKPEEMSQQDLEAQIKVSIDSKKFVDHEGLSLKDRLENDVRVDSRITKDSKYFFTFLRVFKKLDCKEDLMHVFSRHACIANESMSDSSGSKGLYFSDLVGYYIGIEDDIVSLILDKTLVAVNVGIKKVVEVNDDDDRDDIGLKEVLKILYSSRQNCSVVRLFLKLNVMDAFTHSIISDFDTWPKAVQREWRAPQLQTTATTVIKENNEAATFAPFKRMESTGNKKKAASKKTRRQRDYGGHLNSHMKEPDKMGLKYDFGKPFRVSEAEERLELLLEYQAKRLKGDEGGESDFDFDYDDDSDEGVVE
eukprot:TRINITY_DN38158_c0_g1_i1.p1 TRINITY_DN38158_c0_g1~~TRINITY_DN38158_c0_g1_i1.p1  ORF type:complete len:448 (+),score=92.34 TRINITY_DN38158_c0_g1_i1:66-1409(+)